LALNLGSDAPSFLPYCLLEASHQVHSTCKGSKSLEVSLEIADFTMITLKGALLKLKRMKNQLFQLVVGQYFHKKE
jgi:hypothetical protein